MKTHLGDLSPFKNEIKALWAFAFSDPESFVDYYFKDVWKGENAVAITEGETLAAALELVPYTLSVRGKQLPASYIVGVSVAGAYRGRGLSTVLMREGLKKQLAREEILSFLTPFSYPFYEKLGYEKAYEEWHTKARAEEFPKAKSAGNFRSATIEDYEILSRIYEDFCQDKTGYSIRKRDDWDFILKELAYDGGALHLYLDETGTPIAYLAFLKDDAHCKVQEMAYGDDRGRDAILSYVLSHSSYESFDFIFPSGSDLPDNFGKRAKTELRPGAMARLLQIDKGLVNGLGDVKLSVTDAFLPENTGVYAEINGTVAETEQEADVSTDVGALTQLILGYRSAGELLLSGRMKGAENAITQLDKLYPKQETYMNLVLRDDF